MSFRILLSLLLGILLFSFLPTFIGCETDDDDDDDNDLQDDDDNDDDTTPGENEVAVYQIIQLTDPLTQLYADAAALGLDTSAVETEEDVDGWWVLSNDDFDLRRLKNAGYFSYRGLNVPSPAYPVGQEPVTEEEIRTQAIDLLEAIGIPEEQLSDVAVDRVVIGTGKKASQTVSYLVSVRRRIDNYEVHNAEAKVSFNAEGVLQEMTTRWRTIDPDPVRYETLIAADELQQWLDELLAEYTTQYGSYDYDTFSAYLEDLEENNIQQEFVLQYIAVFTVSTSIYEENTPATE